MKSKKDLPLFPERYHPNDVELTMFTSNFKSFWRDNYAKKKDNASRINL